MALALFLSSARAQMPPALLMPTNAVQLRPQTISLGWDACTDSNVTGYQVYWWTNSAGTNWLDVGDVTNTVIANLDSLVTWYFAATCYDDSGDESPLSNIVQWPPLPFTNNAVMVWLPMVGATSPAGPWTPVTNALVTITNPVGVQFFKIGPISISTTNF